MIGFGKILFIIVVVFAFFGDGLKFYQKFFWWDLLLHFIAGISFVSIGLGIAKSVPKLSLKQMLIFSFMFSLSVHVFWELFEFTCDQLFNLNMQRWHFDPNLPDTYGRIITTRTPGIIDTMTDFIANISGTVLMCIGYLMKKTNNKRLS